MTWFIPLGYLSPLLLVWKNSILNLEFLPGQLADCFAVELALTSWEPDIKAVVIVNKERKISFLVNINYKNPLQEHYSG